MNTMLDMICSAVIGGVVLVMLVGFNGNIFEQSAAQTIKIMAQTNLTATTDVIEYEFRKMGYGVPGTDSVITYADSNKIKFKGDFDNNGTIDTLTYYFNPATPSGHANTKTHILYRTWNGQKAQTINLGITQFKLSYFDTTGTPLTSSPVGAPSKIKSMKIAMNIESTVPYKTTTEKYLKLNPGAYWERSIKPKNLR